MRTLPILFSTPMVRSILDGRKTQTRRVVSLSDAVMAKVKELSLSAYQPGDVLYVREAWGRWSPTLGTMPKIYYRADAKADAPEGIIWKPSIHMPKEAARIFLRVTDVGVERLQEITVQGLQNEGLLPPGFITQYATMTSDCYGQFQELWDSTIKPADRDRCGWDANPWVWVYTFERCGKPEGF